VSERTEVRSSLDELHCPWWCANQHETPSNHTSAHSSLCTSVQRPEREPLFVSVEQPVRHESGLEWGPPHVLLTAGDSELLAASAPVMRSLAEQLVAAADIVEGVRRG
jgi:hypothetical protein